MIYSWCIYDTFYVCEKRENRISINLENISEYKFEKLSREMRDIRDGSIENLVLRELFTYKPRNRLYEFGNIVVS